MPSFLPEALSSFASEIDGVIVMIYLIVGVWFIAAEALLIGLILSSRRKEGGRAAPTPRESLRTNAIVLAPVALVLCCDLYIEQSGDPVWHHIKVDVPATADVLVGITGRQFEWKFAYPGPDGELRTEDDVVVNGELHVPVNKKVRFELGSQDVLHSFYVPQLRLKQDAVPGRIIAGWFDTLRTGEFEIACAEICGEGHTRMAAKLVVQTEADFNSWLAAQGDAVGDAR